MMQIEVRHVGHIIVLKNAKKSFALLVCLIKMNRNLADFTFQDTKNAQRFEMFSKLMPV